MPTGAERSALGSWGEQLAARYLQRSGYRILERNYRMRGGEIDLIAACGEYLCFVEVKLRKNDRFGAAAEFVTPAKQERLRRTAARWLQEHPDARQPRFDVIEIYAPEGQKTRRPELRHLENAF